MKKSIKVLHVIYALSGGGAERQLQFLLKFAPADSIHGVLCVEPRDISVAEYGAELFVHQRKGKFDWGLYRYCYTTIKNFKPDVVHVWLPPVITIPAMFMAAIHRIPVIFSYRNLMHFNRLLTVFEYAVAFLCAKKVISNNRIEQSTLPYRALYHLKNGCTISNGLDFTVIGRKAEYQVKTDQPIKMIFVGRLVQQKNIINLIRALAYIPKQYLWQLEVYGKGELLQQAEELVAELGLANKVLFEGFESDIYSKIANSDLLIMPSIREGMPNVLVEALALQIPVVAANISSITDVVEDSNAVILIDPTSPISIAAGIVRYIENQGFYLNNVDNGVEIAKKYDASQMALNYFNEYLALKD